MSPPHASPSDIPEAARGWRRWWPYALIALVTFYCHWFILTNDGPIWDGWYWINWLANRNWAPMKEYTSSQALPYTLWAFAPFAYVSNIVPTAMWASFICLVADGILVYVLGRRLALLNRTDALAIALLAQALPLFSAAQDMPVFGLIVFRTLFYLGALLATLSLERSGWSHWLLRIGALVAFYFSCITNGALLVYYGGVWLLLWIRYRRLHRLELIPGATRFVLRYPDFFIAPPAIFAARMIFLPQFGWYEHYNSPGANIENLDECLWSFVANVIPYHVRRTASWPFEHPIFASLIVAGIAAWAWKAPRQWVIARGETPGTHLYSFGFVLLFFAVFPLAAAGKMFDPRPVGEPSRHCMLAGLPLAILLFAALRTALFWARSSSRWFTPALGALVLVLGNQYLPSYLAERVEWIASRSMLHNAKADPVVAGSSIIASSSCSVFQQVIYGVYGLDTAFGERTRFVAPFNPVNERFFTPSEVEWYCYSTTVMSGEFRRINPAGRQIALRVDRNRGQRSDWDIAMEYLRLRWIGTGSELNAFLTKFTRTMHMVFKEATPMALGATPPPATVAPPGAVPTADFSNGAGMEMARMSWGDWVARYETTQAEFERLMGENPSLFRDPQRPVDCVTWNEAVEFCSKLTELEATAGRLPTGFTYRLPTEAEFNRYAAQSSVRSAVLNEGAVKWFTEPVRGRPADSLGLHDVIGNVWEWCLDPTDFEGRMRISKGGSFSNALGDLIPYTDRVDPRRWLEHASKSRLLGPTRRNSPDHSYWNRGFRVILAAPPPVG